MELEKKPLHEIVVPYLYKFAEVGQGALYTAGKATYQTLKTGFLWVYSKFVNNVVPYAVENLPKILFVRKKDG